MDLKKYIFISFFILISCKDTIIENTVFNKIFYGKRALVLRLDTGIWAAYNTDSATLSMIWEGDMGKIRKVYLPTHEKDTTQIWTLEKRGKQIDAKINYMGFIEKEGTVFIDYMMTYENGKQVRITEHPKYIKKEGSLILERNFSITDLPKNYHLHYYIHLGNIDSKNGYQTDAVFSTQKEVKKQEYIQLSGRLSFLENGEKKITTHLIPLFSNQSIEATLKKEIVKSVAKDSTHFSISLTTIETLKNGTILEKVHPSYDLIKIGNGKMKLKISDMALLSNGKMLISTIDKGAIFLLTGLETNDSQKIKYKKIASHLLSPTSIEVIHDDIFVLQQQEITQLIDSNADGYIDWYKVFYNDWDMGTKVSNLSYNNHHFYLNMVPKKTNMKDLQQNEKIIKFFPNGDMQAMQQHTGVHHAINQGLDQELFCADRWYGMDRIYHLSEDSVKKMEQNLFVENLPSILIPATKEKGHLTQAIRIEDKSLYKNQMLCGYSGKGGVKRIALEKIKGSYQGAIFHFSKGFVSNIDKMIWDKRGSLYITGSEKNSKKIFYGFEKIKYNNKITFEMLRIKATEKGIKIIFTKALRDSMAKKKENYFIQQWNYPQSVKNYLSQNNRIRKKRIQKIVPIEELFLSEDKKEVDLILKNMSPQRLLYIRLSQNIVSQKGEKLWSKYAWYTMNRIPIKDSLFSQNEERRGVVLRR